VAVIAGALLSAPVGAFAKLAPDDVKIGTSIAGPARVVAAQPIKSVAGPVSQRELDQCEGLDAPRLEKLEGIRKGGGYAISPPDVELLNPAPNTDYRACITVLNFEQKGDPISGRIDDLDITSANDASGGISIIDDPSGVGTWITPSTRAITVPPASRLFIPYVIRTPAVLPAGTVVGGISARLTPPGSIRQAITQRVYASSPGGRHKPLTVRVPSSSRIISSDLKIFKATIDARNSSDYLETFTFGIDLSGLGRSVRKEKVSGGALLPDGRMQLKARVGGLPWIGLYRPSLEVVDREGKRKIKLPWVIVLPPWYFVVAIALAVLFPMFVLLRRWRENRLDWQQYLDDDEDPNAYDEEHADEWDPHAPRV